uniref:PR domain containing 8b n=1 Tax=Pundamilia nyererei TaxID=303518 RepID=A0A3B4FGR3_9CICH
MRRHTLPLVERRERLADMKSLTLTVHLKPIGHALSVGRARTSPAPTEGAVVLLSFSFFSFVTKTVFRQCEKSNKTRHDIKWIKIIFIEKSMITQRFQFEFPFLAHLRFRCTKRLHQDNNKPSTDFHNLARDLENNRTSPPSDKEAEICSESSGKRKFSEIEDRECRGPSLPQSKSKDELATSVQNYRGAYGLEDNHRSFSPPGSIELGEVKRSAFTEVKSAQHSKQHSSSKKTQPPQSSPMGSAFTSVSQQGGGSGGERKSAFSQPSRSFSQISPLVMPPKLLDCHPAVGDTISSNRLYQADHLAAKLQGAELGANCPVPGGMAKQNPFVYATAFWPKNSGPIQLQMPSALTLLPPSFTSLCLPAQNWCAKCNASFRMTSDLVYHMRSHHKKEYSMEPLVKRRREEKLKCPICNESFRERHHLSRHMTSHN